MSHVRCFQETMKSARNLLLIAVAALLIFCGYQWYLRSKAFGALPTSIGVEAIKEIRLVPGFPQWLVFGSSGYFLYEIDEKTALHIQQAGLSYLNGASLSPRFLDNDPQESRRQFRSWSASPLLPELTAYTPEGRGFWSGLVHARFSPEFERQVLTAAREPGAYYTSNHHGDILVVMPKLRIAIFSWYQ